MKTKPENPNESRGLNDRDHLIKHHYQFVIGTKEELAVEKKVMVITDYSLGLRATIVSPIDLEPLLVWLQGLQQMLNEVSKQQQELLLRVSTLQTQAPAADELLDNHDLCALLHVGTRTLHRWRSEGKLPAPKIIGGKYYYTKNAIMALFREM